jgi:hypothetical protein
VTYLQATKKGFIDAEKTIDAATKEALAAYDRAYAEITKAVKAQYAKLAGVPKSEFYTEMLKYDRLTALQNEIARAFNDQAKIAGGLIKDGLSSGMKEAYSKAQYLTGWATDIKPIPINPKLVQYTVTGNIKVWAEIQKIYKNPAAYTPRGGTLASLLQKTNLSSLDRILQTIENGIISGVSYNVQALAIKDAVRGAKYQAVRIARTEGQRVLNAAVYQSARETEAAGHEVKKEWLASMDTITRESHSALDGQRRGVDEPFESPTTGATGQAPGQMSQAGDNINCRCTTMTIINDKGPDTRIAINPFTKEREPIDYVSYAEWAKKNKM